MEITNDIIDHAGRGRYEEMDICCIGIIIGDQILQIYREPDINDFAQYKTRAISYLNRYEKMYAFNRDFEYYGLRAYLNLDSICVEEIKPFKGRGWSKDKFFEVLVIDRKVTAKMPADPFHGNAALVIPSWARGDIESILNHNVGCLVKEHYILHHRAYLLRKFTDRIDAGGWYN